MSGRVVDAKQSSFPKDFEILRYDVLQVSACVCAVCVRVRVRVGPLWLGTISFVRIDNSLLQWNDLAANHNKFYVLELHESSSQWRVFTHYGWARARAPRHTYTHARTHAHSLPRTNFIRRARTRERRAQAHR